MKTNWFGTLNEALAAEGLVDVWPLGLNVAYGETVNFITEDFLYVSVYRSSTSSYERPIQYCAAGQPQLASPSHAGAAFHRWVPMQRLPGWP